MTPVDSLIVIFNKATDFRRGDPNIELFTMWQSVFGSQPGETATDEDIATCLQGVRDQVREVQNQLARHNVPAELIDPTAQRLLEITSILNTRRGMGNYPVFHDLHGATDLTLRWASWVLRDETVPTIEEKVIEALREKLNELEALLVQAGLSPYIRAFLANQVSEMRKGLLLYQIQGEVALTKAVRHAVLSAAEDGNQIKRELEREVAEDKGAIAKLSEFFDVARNGSETIDKVIETAQKLASAGTGFLPYIAGVAKALT